MKSIYYRDCDLATASGVADAPPVGSASAGVLNCLLVVILCLFFVRGAEFLLLQCGDVHPNPGPRPIRHPCVVCGGAVGRPRLQCIVCSQLCHKRCTGFDEREFSNACSRYDVLPWSCPACVSRNFSVLAIQQLPFPESDIDLGQDFVALSDRDPAIVSGIHHHGSPAQLEPNSCVTPAALFLQENSNRLILGSWNINSLRGKMDDLRVLFEDLAPHIFGICETKLSPGLRKHQFDIPNHRLIRRDRPGSKNGGGIALYVNNAITVVRKSSFESPSLEALVIDVRLQRRSFAAVMCYKPPSTNTSSFMTSLSNLFEKAVRLRPEVVLMGDLNCNLLGHHAQSGDGLCLSHFLSTFGLQNLIIEPTFPRSGSLLDIIATTNSERVANTVVLATGASDHSICCTALSKKPPHLPHRVIAFRSTKTTHYRALSNDVAIQEWSDCYSDYQGFPAYIGTLHNPRGSKNAILPS